MAQADAVNVTDVIDNERFGAFQWSVAIWCAVLVTLDGFDNSVLCSGQACLGSCSARSARGLSPTASGANA